MRALYRVGTGLALSYQRPGYPRRGFGLSEILQGFGEPGEERGVDAARLGEHP